VIRVNLLAGFEFQNEFEYKNFREIKILAAVKYRSVKFACLILKSGMRKSTVR